VASVWIRTRPTHDGGKRYRVEYRLGGRETRSRYAGSFKTMREANTRKQWVAGELAALRVPDLQLREPELVLAPTVAEAAERWRASRIDVAEGTRTLHRVALGRALPLLGSLHVDEVELRHVVELVAALHASGSRRETIRKTVKYLAAVLDDAGLPLLWLDWSGARVASVDTLLVGDYDEPQRRVRLRASATKTRKALWVELPDVLAEAIEARLPARDDRDPDARLFPGVSADRLRTAIARACRALGVPVFSPHDLRHRRISLLHRQGRSWAEIARFVGQRKLSITADTYTHVLVDGREADYRALLSSGQA
jgi:integrase